MRVDVVETREFQVPKSRIRAWSNKLGLPVKEPIVPTNRAEKSISENSSEGEEASDNLLDEDISIEQPAAQSDDLFNTDTNSGNS